MLYNLLTPFADQFPVFNLFRYITFRAGGAAMTALFSGFALTGVDPAAGLAIKLAVIACVVVSVTALWLLAGAGLTRLFRDPKLNRLVNVIFAALLLASLPFALLF